MESKILILVAIMFGTVDQVNNGFAQVELVAKDGHAHEESIPVWMFPCVVEEGKGFFIETSEKTTIIRCEKE